MASLMRYDDEYANKLVAVYPVSTMCNKMCKSREFSRNAAKPFTLFFKSGETTQILAQSAQGRTSLWYIVYRCFVCVLFLTCLVVIISTHTIQPRYKWLIFLTNWSFMLLCLQTILQLTSVMFNYIHRAKGRDYSTIPLLFKVSWVVNNMAWGVAFIITIMYWGVLFPKITKKKNVGRTFLVHGMNSIYVVVDILVSGMPVRLLHVWQVMVWALIYGAWSVIYWAFGGVDNHGNPYIYRMLNWDEKPTKSCGMLFGLVCISLPLTWTLVFGLYKLRTHVISPMFITTRSDATEQTGSQDKIENKSEITSVSPSHEVA